MKIHECPAAVPAPTIDYARYDDATVAGDQARHRADLAAHFRALGHAGPNTGRVARFGVGDGYAQYMMVEGKTSFLVHLPYGDGYRYPDVAFLPKAEVLRRMEADERIARLFRPSPTSRVGDHAEG